MGLNLLRKAKAVAVGRPEEAPGDSGVTKYFEESSLVWVFEGILKGT